MQKVYKKLTNGLSALYCTRPIRLNNNKTLTANRLCLSCVTAHRREYTNTRKMYMHVNRRSNKMYVVKKTCVEKYQMSFSNGLGKMGLGELGLGEMRRHHTLDS